MHGQGKGQGQIGLAPRHGQGRQASSGKQRDQGSGADSQLAGRAQQGVGQQGNGGGVQPINGRQTREQRVGHALGDEHDPNGQSGEEVGPPVAAAVFGQGLP